MVSESAGFAPPQSSAADVVLRLTALEADSLYAAADAGRAEFDFVVAGDPDASGREKAAKHAAVKRAMDKLRAATGG